MRKVYILTIDFCKEHFAPVTAANFMRLSVLLKDVGDALLLLDPLTDVTESLLWVYWLLRGAVEAKRRDVFVWPVAKSVANTAALQKVIKREWNPFVFARDSSDGLCLHGGGDTEDFIRSIAEVIGDASCEVGAPLSPTEIAAIGEDQVQMNALKRGESLLLSGNLQPFDRGLFGGTFDRLHLGHQLLIIQGLMLARKGFAFGVTTGEALLGKKNMVNRLYCYERRSGEVVRFASVVAALLGKNIDIEYSPLTDSVGIAGTREDCDALIVSEETAPGIRIVNAQRVVNEVKPLRGIILPEIEASVIAVESPGKLASTVLRDVSSKRSPLTVELAADAVEMYGWPFQSDKKVRILEEILKQFESDPASL